MVDAVDTLLKVTAVPGRICEDDVNAVPTVILLLVVATLTTGTSESLSPMVTESPTATFVTLINVNAVVPIPAVFPTDIAVSKTFVVLVEDAELTKKS